MSKTRLPRRDRLADADRERCDPDQVERIARGRYTEACLAIGQANLPTILAAEQQVSAEMWTAQARGEPHRGYLGRLQLVKVRRRRLQAEAQRRSSPVGQRVTLRV